MMAYPGDTDAAARHRRTSPPCSSTAPRDLLVPLSAARRMSAAHPGWRFEIAPDTGHVPMLEAPRVDDAR